MCRRAGALVVQGPECRRHRSIFLGEPSRRPPLLELVAPDPPISAFGGGRRGLGDAAAVRRARDAGAAAAQVGTAPLLCDEAGTQRGAPPRAARCRLRRHRGDPRLPGRYAQPGQRVHREVPAPLRAPGYPQLNQMTGPSGRPPSRRATRWLSRCGPGTAWRGIGERAGCRHRGGVGPVIPASAGQCPCGSGEPFGRCCLEAAQG